jgi:signal transduction histidine kinase
VVASDHDGAPAEPPRQPGSGATHFLAGGGEMAKLIASMDWSQTPLGAIENWPQGLKTTVSLCVASSFPISLAWGPRHTQIYNDGYWPICGGKHPDSMGQDFTECWASAWPVIGEAFDRALAGETQFLENQRMFLDRNGYLEETFFTFSFSPIRDGQGAVQGLFHPVTETTSQMLSERRTRVLRDLANRTGKAKTTDEACKLAAQALADSQLDVPFSLFFALDSADGRLVASTGLGTGAASTDVVAANWPLDEAMRAEGCFELDDVRDRISTASCGPYPELPRSALLVPLRLPGATTCTAVAVLGVSSRLPFTETYRDFYELVAGTLTAALGNASAYQEERKRAEALAEIDRAKTEFFSNVSHEFRTPLTLILGPVEDALSRPEGSLAGAPLTLVRRNALRLYKMVNDLLDFSRAEAGRAQATFVPTDLAAFTAQLSSHFQSAIEDAGVKLVVECAPLPEAVYVDPDMWEKVVFNLLSNALKHTYRGEIRVHLGFQDDTVTLSVRDTGIGIADSELPRVLQRFYRVPGARGRSHEGTGIGLALVQQVASLHGGSVSVTSKLGQGSTFEVRIPRGFAHLPPEHVASMARPRSSTTASLFMAEVSRWSMPSSAPSPLDAEAVAPSAGLPSGLSSARILLADDNRDLRAYVSGVLRQAFPNVETVANGQLALERVRSQRPDLLISDVMMPELDGFGLVRALRADERTRAIPIILLSARAGDEASVEGLESGADDYLVKPFSARELLARVRTQLEMAEVRRQLAQREYAEEQLRSTLLARDEWITVVSHELRTPLTALVLSIQSLIRSTSSGASGATDERARAQLRSTEKNLNRLTQQVEQLVDMAGLISGQIALTLEERDLAELVVAVVEERRQEASAKDCALSVHASSPVLLRFDRQRLRQLLEKLLDNALKFGIGRPVEVLLAKDAGHATISVIDHGSGIAAEDRERAFQRFQRATSTRQHGGFGLGLWVTRLIAEAHGGSIVASETEGGGATLSVRLPVAGPKRPD